MKKNHSVSKCGGAFGTELTPIRRLATVRGDAGARSFPVRMAAVKDQVHKVPVLRVGAASCSAR